MRTAGLVSGLIQTGLLLGALAAGTLAAAATAPRILELSVPGVEGTVTCMAGPRVPDTQTKPPTGKWLWYYLPQSFRLEEATQSNGKKLPALVLVRYQTKDPRNPGRLREAALLRFTLNLGLPDATLSELKREIAKQMSVPGQALTEKDIRLDLAGSWDPCLTLLTQAGKVVVAGAKQVPTLAPHLGSKVTLEARIDAMAEDLAKLLCAPGSPGLRLQLAMTCLHPDQGKWAAKEFSVEGSLSLASWPKTTQETCITSLQGGSPFLYYTLPELGSSDQLTQSGVALVDLSVGVLDRDGKEVGSSPWTFMAKAKDGFVWRNAKGEPLGLLGQIVPAASLRAKYGSALASMTYQSRFFIGLEGPPRRFGGETRSPLLSGEDPFSKPQLGAWMIHLSAEEVTFYGDRFAQTEAVPEVLRGKQSDLKSLSVRVKGITRDPVTHQVRQQSVSWALSKGKPTTAFVLSPGDGDHPVQEATFSFDSKIERDRRGSSGVESSFSKLLEEGIRTLRLTDADWLSGAGK